MKPFFTTCLCVFVMLLGFSATASAQCFLTDGTATFSVFTNGGPDSPSANYTDTDVSTGNQVFEWGYYYRIDGDLLEDEFNAVSSSNCPGGNTGQMTWNDLGGRGLLSAVVDLTLTDTGTGSTLTGVVTINNITTVPVSGHIFHYVDIDAEGSFGGDTATDLGGGVIEVTEGSATIQYNSQATATYSVGPFAALELGLNDGDLDDFTNTGLPFGPGDFTGGFQNAVTVAPNPLIPQVLIFNLGANANAPLPVELAGFDAIADDGDVLLKWATSSETNNAGFEVEARRMAEDEFAMIGYVEGHGTTTEAQRYTYRVRDLDPGTYVFRLKQVDYDGQFEYSTQVHAEVGVPGGYMLTAAYPNPFNPRTVFSVAVAAEQEVNVSVYNVQGQRVRTLYHGLMPANETHTLEFNAAGLNSGTYFYQVTGRDFRETRKVILMK